MRNRSYQTSARRPLGGLLAAAVAATFAAGCDVDQTQEGELPDVDVSVEEGQMPAYDVDWASVDVGTREKTVEVPKLVVVQETETIEVPYIDMNMPDEGPSTERTVAVELELTERSGELDIQSVHASERRLFVISRFEQGGESLDDQRVRISDQLQLNAPEDLDIRHIIVGTRPEGSWNDQYRFVPSMSEARSLVGADARELYSA